MAADQPSVSESVKVTVHALRYYTSPGATRRLSNHFLRGAEHPSDISKESGFDNRLVA